MAALTFVGMLPLTPHAFFAWRVTFVALGLARCSSLPLRLLPFLSLLLTFVIPLFSRIFLRVAMCWGGAAARGCRSPAGRDADRAYKRRSIGDEQESDWM